jgi:N-acyl-D-amino-acid deacylase
MGLPLHFDPGTKYSYSNYGFMLLARVVERVAGEPYEEFVRRNVFAPMGIRRAALGRDAYDDAFPGEVRYYEVPRMILEFPLIPGARRLLPRPYANFELLAGDGCGQWIASPIDLVRFIAAVEGSRSPAFLKPATFELFLERPQPFVSEDPTGGSWYGLGTVAGVRGNGRSWTHAGAYPGSLAVYQSFGNGVAYAIALNAWPPDITGALTDVGRLVGDFCLNQPSWPSHDLFPTYYPEN